MTAEHNPAPTSTPISWPLDESTIDATLVIPPGDGPFPGVVLVAGSGPTDRDWNTPLLPGTNGSARLLAEVLAHAGIASIRYDKRASGPRAMANVMAMVGRVSMQSHLDELAGAVRHLASDPRVRRDRIFGVGNSEGTLHVLNYALHPFDISLAGLVLIAPPGRSVGAVARSQIAAQVAPLPGGEAMMSLYDAAIERFAAGLPVDPDPSLPPGIAGLLQTLAAPANLPFARELWMTDGSPLLHRVRIPVLVVIGQKDIQVDWHADGDPLQLAASGNDHVTFTFPEHANHVLKYEPRPRAELGAQSAVAYNAEGVALDPESTCLIVKWISEHAAG